MLEIFYNFSSKRKKRKKIEKTKLLHITGQEQQPSNSVYDKVIVAAVKTKEKSWTSERERKRPQNVSPVFMCDKQRPAPYNFRRKIERMWKIYALIP